jgi:hypothetical protein
VAPITGYKPLPPIEVAPRLQGDFPKSIPEFTRRCAEEQRRRILARALSGFARPEPKQIRPALEHPQADADVTATYRRKIPPTPRTRLRSEFA